MRDPGDAAAGHRLAEVVARIDRDVHFVVLHDEARGGGDADFELRLAIFLDFEAAADALSSPWRIAME